MSHLFWFPPDGEHDGRKDECICDWSGLPGDFDPDPACAQHGRTRADKFRAGLCVCEGGIDPECPKHGKRPWASCELCNYDQHQCPGCGRPMPHGGQRACHECNTDDLPPRGLIVYEVGESPYEPSGQWASGPM